MNKHYVYILKNKIDGRLYIGDRTAPNGNPYKDTKYKSSCKVVSKEYKENCMKRILKTFETREEAKEYEIFLHNKYDVGNNPRFFNGAKQTSVGFDTSGITPPHTKTDEWKEKCRIFNMTRIYQKVNHSKETREKISATWKKKYQNGYIPRAKKKHTKESIQKMKDSYALRAKTGYEHQTFKPWFIIKPDGTKITFLTITKKEQSVIDGFPPYTYEAVCTRSKGVKPMKQGQLKGYIIGNIVDDIV